VQPQPIDTATIRSAYQGMPGHLAVDRLCAEIERLRAENDGIVAAVHRWIGAQGGPNESAAERALLDLLPPEDDR